MKTHRNSIDHHAGGFSVVEVMVALAIAAILLAVGASAMGSFVKNNRVQGKTSELLRSLHFARSEAAKRKVRVVLCPSADPFATTPSCGGTTSTWTTGYLVFASGDSNNTYQQETDALLRIGRAAGRNLTVITNSTSNKNLAYNADGTINEDGNTARFAICDNRGGEVGRQINVAPVGRAALEKGTSVEPVGCTSPS